MCLFKKPMSKLSLLETKQGTSYSMTNDLRTAWLHPTQRDESIRKIVMGGSILPVIADPGKGLLE
jgi:hypothetical protein